MQKIKIILFFLFCFLILANQNIIEVDEPEMEAEVYEVSISDAELTYFKSIHNPEIVELVYKYCVVYKVDFSLMVSLIECESGFNIYAYNANIIDEKIWSVDRGLCQLNSRTFPWLTKEQFYTPEINIQNGCKYLRWCIDNAFDNHSGVLVYNGGIYNFEKHRLKEKTYKYALKVMAKKKKHDINIIKIYEKLLLKRQDHIIC